MAEFQPELEDFLRAAGFAVQGGAHSVTPVEEVPEISLIYWGIYKAWKENGEPTLHGVGWHGEGRASTAIVEFLPQGTEEGAPIRFRTASGRLYELKGRPGINPDASYVWGRWKNINGIVKDEDVSHEYYPRK